MYDVQAEAVLAAQLEQQLDGVELGLVGPCRKVGCIRSPVGAGGVEVRDGGADRGLELRVHQQRQPGARDVWNGTLQVGAIDRGEAVAARIDEEALEAGNSGECERLEVMLVAVDRAAPEGVVDHALVCAAGPTLRRCFALELQRADGGRLGQAVQRHVDDGSEASGSGGSGGRGEALPLGAARLVDVSVDVDEPGQQGEVAKIFDGNVGSQLRDRLDGGDVLALDDDRCLALAMGRDDAARAESVYHVADYLPFAEEAGIPPSSIGRKRD